MLKRLKRMGIGERFFGYVHAWERLGEYERYIIREHDGTDCCVWLDESQSGQLERDGHSLDRCAGGYAEVVFPGFFRNPRINMLPSYIILNPYEIIHGKTKVPNWESEIVPVSTEVIDNKPRQYNLLEQGYSTGYFSKLYQIVKDNGVLAAIKYDWYETLARSNERAQRRHENERELASGIADYYKGIGQIYRR